MDTLSLSISFKNTGVNIPVEVIREQINSMESPYGYTYCDFMSLNREGNFTIKLSYPRFFAGINARLVEVCNEVLMVNKHFSQYLNQIARYYQSEDVSVEIIRIDIPFTFMKPKDMDFKDYQNIFRILSKIYYRTKENRN